MGGLDHQTGEDYNKMRWILISSWQDRNQIHSYFIEIMISFNYFLLAYLGVYVAVYVADLAINSLNTSHQIKYGGKIPETFKGFIEQAELEKISRYTHENTRFTQVQTSFSKLVFLLIILSGILPWLAKSLSGTNFVAAGLIFFAILGLLMAVTDLPFDYYHSFVIEERYGFNTKTVRIWLSDLIKSLLLASVIGAILLSALLLMVRYAGDTWWVWGWVIFLVFQLLMTMLYPTLIAPLFNKFTPVQDQGLVSKIEALAEREGLRIQGIYQMDSTKRTTHTNAYLSGLGRTKRIVLFDSLIRSHDADEIVAILAHEIGHLKRGHTRKLLAMVGLVSGVLFYVASKMLTWEAMYLGFGFSSMPMYAGIFLAGVLWEPASFILAPIMMAVSRMFEREADLYCVRILKSAEPFSRSLKKLAKENLCNLRPHPVYVWFNCSHPTLLERIKRIES